MVRKNREYVLRVGEAADIKRSFFGASYSVIYAGMPGESVYSLVITRGSGYQGIAYNLFLPLENREIILPVGAIKVISVSSYEIQLSFGR